jgi:hypothetical protein
MDGLSIVTSRSSTRGEQQPRLRLAFRWKHLDVVDLTYSDGRLIGQLLAASDVSDVVDAHVVVLARERGWPVVTSEPDGLHRLDPKLALHVV